MSIVPSEEMDRLYAMEADHKRALAEIVLLKDALVQAQHTVGFLRGCLLTPSQSQIDDLVRRGATVSGGYHHAYPEHDVAHLKEWADLAPQRTLCIHSIHRPAECESCAASIEHRQALAEAYEVLGKRPPWAGP